MSFKERVRLDKIQHPCHHRKKKLLQFFENVLLCSTCSRSTENLLLFKGVNSRCLRHPWMRMPTELSIFYFLYPNPGMLARLFATEFPPFINLTLSHIFASCINTFLTPRAAWGVGKMLFQYLCFIRNFFPFFSVWNTYISWDCNSNKFISSDVKNIYNFEID